MNYKEIRKKTVVGTKHNRPKMGLNLPKGEFRFYNLAIDLIGLNTDKQALMFKINESEKKVKIIVEFKEDDNYHLTDRKGYKAFVNKNLGNIFSDIFELKESKTYYFKVDKINSEIHLRIIE